MPFYIMFTENQHNEISTFRQSFRDGKLLLEWQWFNICQHAMFPFLIKTCIYSGHEIIVWTQLNDIAVVKNDANVL
jgi:hypothetical protein